MPTRNPHAPDLFNTHSDDAQTPQTPAATAPPPDSSFVRVALERGIDRVTSADAEPTFTYRHDAPIPVGSRVRVPLGRSDKPTPGVVVAAGSRELLAGFDASRVKPVLEVEPTSLPPSLVELAQWMARYYICPLGMVLTSMLPAAVKHKTGLRQQQLLDLPSPPRPEQLPPLTPKARQAWEQIATLSDDLFPITPMDLKARLGISSLAPINRLIALGLLTRTSAHTVKSRSSLWESIAPDRHTTPGPPPTPTRHQQSAIDALSRSLGSFSSHLLFGVTGSGKTEVYLQLIQRAIATGKSAIVLVPEISLTPQTAARFLDRLGNGQVAVLHSALTASQRHAQWRLAAEGKVRVVVGPRSAVFAPLHDLGAIIVDEEHAEDYKQDHLPRYNARDVAIKRAQIQSCPVLLASATPSLESWTLAHQNKHTLHTLPQRVGGGTLPPVRIVDMAQDTRARAAQGLSRDSQISLPLRAALRETLDAGAQAILLLNRRGLATHVRCSSAPCSWVMRCDECDAGMVVHRHTRSSYVECHHCQARQLLPKTCPVCDSRVITLGSGTQRIEEELLQLFPELTLATHTDDHDQTEIAASHTGTLARADRDSMTAPTAWLETLARFRAGDIRVLLGTQMVAKGLDFPNVRLVGVINADTALALPDFRAEERTFQLVAQVAGRAGRADTLGSVIVQTFAPDAPPIVHAANHDYTAFATQELQTREQNNLPPISRMARVVVRDTDHAAARKTADDVALALRAGARTVSTNDVLIVGPMDAPISRIAGHFRIAVEITAPSRQHIQAILTHARNAASLTSDATTAVDVDPLTLM